MNEESLPAQLRRDPAAEQAPNVGEDPRLMSRPGDEPPPARPIRELIFLLVILFNAVTVGLGGLYESTGSVVVVTAAACLVALLGGLCLAWSRRSAS